MNNERNALMMIDANAVVETRGLGLWYEGFTALDGIDLRVTRGSIVGLVGRNGAGKSSLLHCLLGLTRAQRGSARLLGCDAGALDDATRNRLGFCSQRPDLLEWLTVDEHVAYIGAFYERWSAERARELAMLFELPGAVRVRSLSPGELQRLSIVLALAHDPELVVLDEPVASLDPLARREFMRTLFEGTPGRTAIISSHLLGDLERVVSHIVFLRRGRVQLAGEWDEIAENVRQVESGTALPPQPGLVASHEADGAWRHIVDRRTFARDALAPGAGERSLNLDDLFAELQA
jgi:ABC-2 type transport system ATP-binding protein